MGRTHLTGFVSAIGMAILLTACGGSSTSPSDTGSGSSGGTTAGPIAATITITASGVSPKSVTIPVGSSVNFVNNDTGGPAHDMASDPHPVHTDCPAINLVGQLTAGQSRATGALTTARTCGFHDHNNPTTASLQGTIVIQ